MAIARLIFLAHHLSLLIGAAANELAFHGTMPVNLLLAHIDHEAIVENCVHSNLPFSGITDSKDVPSNPSPPPLSLTERGGGEGMHPMRRKPNGSRGIL
jgi:hypothetical protein